MHDTLDIPQVKASQRQHYVNNKEFSQAVVDYVNLAKKARDSKKPEPDVTEYIGSCFLKIAEGLSHKPNFIRYTYREEMVMDAVENCLKAIHNYNISAATRSGLPNAFAYFTQISYYAFLRRIAKEKKQQDIKMLYMEHAGIDSFAHFGDQDGNFHTGGESIIERIRHKVDSIHKVDSKIKEFGKTLKNTRKRNSKGGSSAIDMFLS